MSFKTNKTKHVFSFFGKHFSLVLALTLIGMIASVNAIAQSGNSPSVAKGILFDEQNEPMIGVNVLEKGTSNGTISDISGKFQLKLTKPSAILVFTYIGYQKIEAKALTTEMRISMVNDSRLIEEVVVVGYGSQKKASVVGSISQAKGDDLKRAGGVSSLTQALTGNLPGVITVTGTGRPGDENAKIYVRGQSTWNNTEPLILVDGIERKINDVDPNEVESISTLKDASATAVYGVEGANGVILITTKRGKLGKPVLTFEGNMVSKTISKMYAPTNLLSALKHRNYAIENNVAVAPLSWNSYFPDELIKYYDKSLYPAAQYPEIDEIYPNVKWQDVLLKDNATSGKLNVSLRGGTNFVKYFGSLSYSKEGDIMNTQDLGAGYVPENSYSRFNYRSNLDFSLTSTTKLTVNLSGFLSTKRETGNNFGILWNGVYGFPSNIYQVQYSNDYYGMSDNSRLTNPFVTLNRKGVSTTNTSQINTDYKLSQKLDFITKGLSAGVDASLDYSILTTSAINDASVFGMYYLREVAFDDLENKEKYAIYKNSDLDKNNFYSLENPISRDAESIKAGSTSRNLFYQFKLEYAREFGKHDVAALALVNRREKSYGNEFKTYREDWVGRVTYNYDRRYFVEMNGAYNGSDNFSAERRFEFFPSLALGWTLTNEKFMKEALPKLSLLKFRYSTGKTGNDRIGAGKWPYVGTYAPGNGTYKFGHITPVTSPYGILHEKTIATPDIHWEVSKKQNYGVEFGIFDNIISGNFDYYNEHRNDIFLASESRNIPQYSGYLTNPPGNIGIVDSWGWEFELKFAKTFKKVRLWSNYALTFADNKVIYKEDGEFAPDYQKVQGFSLGQNRSNLNTGIIQDWNEFYGGVLSETTTTGLPGDFRQIDFNADGFINSNDAAPYKFTLLPKNTYSWSLGADYKGFSAMFQFYGVFNSTRDFNLTEFPEGECTLYDVQINNSWLPQENRTNDATYKSIRFGSAASTGAGNYYIYDGSYLRLKTVELAYTFNNNNYLKKAGISNMRLYVNGNNLFLWSDIIHETESGNTGGDDRYPNMRRINVGTSITF